MSDPGLVGLTFREFALLLGGLGPQLLGGLSLWWAFRRGKRVLMAPALLVAPALHLALADLFWAGRADAFQAAGLPACFGLTATVSMYGGAAVHLALSSAAFIFLALAAERRSRRLEETDKGLI